MAEPRDRLYGLPGAEVMHLTLADCYESDVEHYEDQPDDRSEVVEEWTVYSPTHHLPTAEQIAEWSAEWAADNGEVDENGAEDINNLRFDPEVVTAIKGALAIWASKVTYRIAHTKVAEHLITWDDDGNPLANGQPIYGAPAPSDGEGEQ